MTRFGWRGNYVVAAVVLMLFWGSAAYAQGGAVLTIGSDSGVIGDEVTIPITLTTNGTEPAALYFRVLFDSASLQYKGASAGPAATEAFKDVAVNVLAPGTLRFLISMGLTAMDDGVVAYVTFEIISTENGETFTLVGEDSTASDPDGDLIALDIVPGAIEVTCVGPDAPETVTASEGRADGVMVTWTAPVDATEYRVYRSTTNNPASAAGISVWTASLNFLDVTAAVPTVTGGGCAPRVVTNRPYFYWVRARNIDGCPGPLSTSAEGYRGKSKSFLSDAKTLEQSLPSRPAPASRLSVRLRSATPIAPHTVWAAVDNEGAVLSDVQWIGVNADNTDGWVVVRPDAEWPAGETVQLTVGAKATSGVQAAEASAAFSIHDEAEPAEVTDAVEFMSEAVPELDRGVGDVFEIAPAGPYVTPREVWLPVPAGLLGQDVEVFYYQQTGDGMGWHAGDNVEGWLVPNSVSVERNGKADCIVFEVTHGGIVQLGLKPELISGASVLGANIADMLVTLGVLLLLVLIRRVRARAV